MSFKHFARACTAGCATVLALAGCGGSGGLSRAQLASRVNAACSAYNSQLKALGPQPNDFAQNSASAAAYLDKLGPVVAAAYGKISTLKPDDSIKSDFQRFLSAAKQQDSFFEGARTKAHAGDPAALQDISSAGNLKRDVLTPMDRKLGFTSCLSG